MKSPSLFGLLLLIIALVIGFNMKINSKAGDKMNPETLTKAIESALINSKDAKFVVGNCESLMPGVEISGVHCLLSPIVPERLLPLVKSEVDLFGITPGWTNDYSAWGAFYEYKDKHEITFGINIIPMEGNLDFANKPEYSKFKSLVTLVADEKKR